MRTWPLAVGGSLFAIVLAVCMWRSWGGCLPIGGTDLLAEKGITPAADIVLIEYAPGWQVANQGDVESLGLSDSGRFKFVWVDSCFGGRADMAFAFGMNSDQNHENQDQAYVGWDVESVDDEQYTAFHGSFWFWFSAGADAAQALWLAGWEVSQDIWQNARTFGYPEQTYMEP